MRKPGLSALLSLLFLAHSFAQTSNATLGGTVSDSTRALIPGVTITATNTGTGIVTNVITNEAGAYQFASLQTGTYTLKAELPGFQTQTYNQVALGGSQQVRLNFTLQVSSVATAVEVTAAADTLIATTSSSVGSVLPDYKVRDLPRGFRAKPASETDLDRDQQTRLGSSRDDERDRSDVQLTPLDGTISPRCKGLQTRIANVT